MLPTICRSVGQIYLYDNPLLKKPLALAPIKPRLLGHGATTPGSIHEGGELGYSLSHAFGTAFVAAHGEDMPEIRNWRWGKRHEKSSDAPG